MSENAEPLTEGAQSQTMSVLTALIEQHCHLSLGISRYGKFYGLVLSYRDLKDMKFQQATEKQRLFIKEYVSSGDALESARVAGYSDRSLPCLRAEAS